MSEYHKVSDFRQHMQNEYSQGISRGLLLGWRSWRDAFSVIPGTTLYLYGPPSSGKTTLKNELLRQLTEYYGWNHMIFDPETGDLPTVSSNIVKTWVGQDLSNTYKNQMKPSEMIAAQVKTNGHNYLLDAMAKRWTMQDVWDAFKKAQDREKKKIHTISVDPFNYLKHDRRSAGGNWADYLEEFLPEFLTMCRKEEVYGIIVTHLRDQQQQQRTIDKVRYFYYPPGTPREIAGGQVWYRMGMSMISVWRPPKWWEDEDGYPVDRNEVHVFFDKKKPDGVSDPGNYTDMTKLFWDYKRKRFFEKDSVGVGIYPNNPQSTGKKLYLPDDEVF